ncbi:MAG: hypothetical protein ACI93T_003995, partial [Porticoccaceae bacterium]
ASADERDLPSVFSQNETNTVGDVERSAGVPSACFLKACF